MLARRVCFPFVGDSVGGAHISVSLLIEGLRNTRYEPVVVVHEDGPLTGFLDARGITYQRIALPSYVGSRAGAAATAIDLLRSCLPLVKFVRRADISIVHCNDSRMNMTWVVPSRVARAKFVWHQRAVFTRQRSMTLLIGVAHETLCLSQFVAQGLPSRARCRIVPNPFETNGFVQPARERLLAELGRRDEAVVLGFFGRLVGGKRPDFLVDVLAHVARKSNRDVVGCIFGADAGLLGPEIAAYAADRGVADRVFLMGFRDPIAPWIAACDVMLAPSLNEAFGRSVVEAMSAGVPVIASRSGAHGEIVDDGVTGFLFDPSSPEEAAALLVGLISDIGMHQRIAGNARDAAATRYSVEQHVRHVTDVYDSLMD